MDVYEKLREILDMHPSGAPKSKVFDEILKTLFTPEEAALLLHMNYAPKPVEAIASSAGLAVEEADRMLASLADRVLVFGREKGGKRSYGLLPTIPGLFEFPFMRGEMTPELKKLGKLWHEYHRDGLLAAFYGNPTPVARVIPVEKSVDAGIKVHPYEEVKNLIDSVDFIGLGQCACRVIEHQCDKPTEMCLFFDAPARFLVEKKYARQITREEAHDVLNRAEEAGLVHTSTNSADKAGFICNCCRCCCLILKGRTEFNLPHPFMTSGFQAEVKAEECTGCGICADERCPMGAIEMRDDIAFVIQEKCIGCGLCATACPAEAIVLMRRSEQPEIPITGQELLGKVLTEKGKLTDFMRLMKS
jgi:Na+-translocating ferredoxin:NAD+ oxidoreductase subunit B